MTGIARAISAIVAAIATAGSASAQMFVRDTSGERTRADFLEMCSVANKSTKPFECWDLLETGFIGIPKHGFTAQMVAEEIGRVDVGEDNLQESNRGTLHTDETLPTAPRVRSTTCFVRVLTPDAPGVGTRDNTVTSPTLSVQESAPYHLAFLHDHARRACAARGGGADECIPMTSYVPPNTASSVTAYMVGEDVGVDHIDIAGRVSNDRFLVGEESGSKCARWQGTHTAALTAGTIHGVAKGAFIVPVVANPGCREVYSVRHIVRGLQWIIEHRAKHATDGPAVVIMSVHASVNRTDKVAIRLMEDLIRILVDMRVTVVAAAMARGTDECAFSPGNMDEVITVGALDVFLRGGGGDRGDGDSDGAGPDSDEGFSVRRWNRSNIGKCVDVWAPGSLIESAFAPGVDATAVYSGTPQAAAITGGVIASILHANSTLTPQAVKEQMLARAYDASMDVGPVLQL